MSGAVCFVIQTMVSDKSFTVKLVIRIDAKSFTCQTHHVDNDFPTRFAQALVSEIKAEMGRQGLSSRGLARLMDVQPQFVTSRLDGGNPRTGERVLLTVRDLSAIGAALKISELDLVDRAQRVAAGEQNVIPGYFGARDEPKTELRAVAKKKSRDRGGDDGQG